MRCKQLRLLGIFAALPVLAQVANVPPSEDGTRHMRPQLGPARDLVDHHDGTSTSTNWSGYAALGTSFTWAKGSWVVPTATCTGVSGDQYAAFWVGLDGYTSTTVEQTGTDSDCVGSKPNYYAWYEFYPKASVTISSIHISPGDSISALVYYDASTEKFIAQITDETNGETFATSSAVSGAQRSSAEWITEAPCCTLLGGILPLSDFGTVSFGKDASGVAYTNWALDSTVEGAIGKFPPADIEEINKTESRSSPQTSTCSGLSTDGTSFTCTWAQ
jgi:hypothetical protein